MLRHIWAVMQTDVSPYDTDAREEADALREEQRQLAAINEVEEWRWLMSGPRGRRIVRRILARAGVHKSSFRDGGDRLAFYEGERNVGLWLTALISEHCPAEYILMLQEKN